MRVFLCTILVLILHMQHMAWQSFFKYTTNISIFHLKIVRPFLDRLRLTASSIVSGSGFPRVSGKKSKAMIPPMSADPPIINKGKGFQYMVPKRATWKKYKHVEFLNNLHRLVAPQHYIWIHWSFLQWFWKLSPSPICLSELFRPAIGYSAD